MPYGVNPAQEGRSRAGSECPAARINTILDTRRPPPIDGQLGSTAPEQTPPPRFPPARGAGARRSAPGRSPWPAPSGAALRIALVALAFVTGLRVLPAQVPGSPAASSPGEGEQRLGIALAGGGALGFAHLGVLLELESLGISPQYVAGTSIGGIVGALYSVGYSPSEILTIAETVDWNSIFFGEVNRRELAFEARRAERLYRGRLAFSGGELLLLGGASSGQSIVEFIDTTTRSAAPVEDFSRLPREFAAVAADLVSGEEVVFTGGSLTHAVRASMAVPGAFSPTYYDGRFLIDGGWVNNIPVDVSRDQGAELVIAVNLSLLNREAEELRGIPAILNQASRILRQEKIEENLARADLVITPDLRGFSTADFGRWRELVDLGREAAREQRSALRRIAGEARAHPVAADMRPERDVQVQIGNVRVRAPGFLTIPRREEIVRRLSDDLVGTVRVSAIQDAVYQLHDSGRFRSVNYDLVRQSDESFTLDVYLTPRARSSAELQLGVGFRTQPVQNIYVRSVVHGKLSVPFLRADPSGLTALSSDIEGPRDDATAGPARTDTEEEPPGAVPLIPEVVAEGWLSDSASVRLGLLVPAVEGLRGRARVYALAVPIPFYDDNTLESLYQRRSAGSDLSVVAQPGRQWRFEAGGYGEWAWTERAQGAAVLDDEPGEPRVGFFGEAIQDNLDQGVFPGRGVETRLTGRLWWTPDAIAPRIRVQAEQRSYVPLGPDASLEIRAAGATDLDSGLRARDQFFAGGIERIPGYYLGELRARHLAAVTGTLRYALFDLPLALGDRAYLMGGATLARTWSRDLAALVPEDALTAPEVGARVGLGFDTPLGEITVGVAMNGSLRVLSYILVGPVATPDGEVWFW